MENFWDYSVWGSLNLVAILLISLLGAAMIRKAVPVLRDSLIPTSVLGGGILVVIAGIYKFATGNIMFDTANAAKAFITTKTIPLPGIAEDAIKAIAPVAKNSTSFTR